ncbi:MAG: Rha family transcriptional regulator [Spirochaetes bacterium]|nr:Rha family transcriptional regulator [Spirochaetota bacterium]
MNNLLTVKRDEIYVSTNIIANELKREHRTIYKLVETYEKELKTLGVLAFEMLKPKTKKGGAPLKVYYLNEEQFIFLIMNMRTKANEIDTVMKMKLKISKQFHQMKKWIIEQKTQKQNEQYIETRNQSKIERKQETDIIKIFIEYAKKQGSKSSDKYYMIYSKMENSAFFILKEKFKNVREILNIQQLSKIIVADMIVKTAIIEGMNNEMYYKDIFQLAKKRVIEMSKSLGFKEILPNIEIEKIGVNEDV